MINHGMQYNSQLENMKIAEYGRNVQNLINYTKKVEDKEERQRLAEGIVDLMYQMNPMHNNDKDYREKLWRHLFRIAEYELDVVPPSGVIPTPEESEYKPAPIEYPENQKSFRHYGYHVKMLIEKASKMEDPEKQEEFALIIASYMKLAYRTWNREHYVSDEIIKRDLGKLSNGALKLDDDVAIDISAVNLTPKRTYTNNNNNRRKSNSRNNNNKRGYSRSNNNNRNKRRR